jgi:hypoxanthine phosphoribosyltransferase
MNPIRRDIKKVLISSQDIQAKVRELAAIITEDYRDKDLVMICVLKGAVVFFSDLFKYIELPVSCDFISISSYGSSTRSSGEVRLLKDVDNSVEGKDVLIVEDIVDTGLTLKYLKEIFRARSANSVKACTLLDKPSRRTVDLKPDYLGFQIPDEFVVGYGLDYAEKFRNLPDVCVLSEDVYTS